MGLVSWYTHWLGTVQNENSGTSWRSPVIPAQDICQQSMSPLVQYVGTENYGSSADLGFRWLAHCAGPRLTTCTLWRSSGAVGGGYMLRFINPLCILWRSIALLAVDLSLFNHEGILANRLYTRCHFFRLRRPAVWKKSAISNLDKERSGLQHRIIHCEYLLVISRVITHLESVECVQLKLGI